MILTVYHYLNMWRLTSVTSRCCSICRAVRHLTLCITEKTIFSVKIFKFFDPGSKATPDWAEAILWLAVHKGGKMNVKVIDSTNPTQVPNERSPS